MPWGRRPPAIKKATRLLEVALSKVGPMSLSYIHENKWIIREHIIGVVSDHPTLLPRAEHLEGSSEYLLQVVGALPLKKLVQSAFPAEIGVKIWIHPRYPLDPPSVTVSLPSAAEQAPLLLNHPFVDPASGAVTTPYLVRWSDPDSGSSSPNLSQVVHNLIKIFTYWPPFAFTVPPPTVPTPEAPLTLAPATDGQDMGTVVFSTAAGEASSSSYQGNRTTTSTPSPREAADRIAMALLCGLADFKAEVQNDVAGLNAVKAELNDRAADYNRAEFISSIYLGQVLQEVERVNDRVNDLVEWLKNMDTSQFPEDAPEGAFELDKDMRIKLEEHSGSHAIDDLIARLDKAAEEKIIQFDSYLKQVRGLAREQATYIQREAINALFPDGLPQSGSIHKRDRH